MGLRQEFRQRRRRVLCRWRRRPQSRLSACSQFAPRGGRRPHAEPCQRPAAAERPIEDERYDRATKCLRQADRGRSATTAATAVRERVPLGMKALQNWLEPTSAARLGRHALRAAQGRQLQPPLRGPRDRLAPRRRRREGATGSDRLIDTLLATDRNGNVRALARRMGDPGPDLRLPRLVGGDGGTRRVQLLLSAKR